MPFDKYSKSSIIFILLIILFYFISLIILFYNVIPIMFGAMEWEVNAGLSMIFALLTQMIIGEKVLRWIK